jgi:hypothetical protein
LKLLLKKEKRKFEIVYDFWDGFFVFFFDQKDLFCYSPDSSGIPRLFPNFISVRKLYLAWI